MNTTPTGPNPYRTPRWTVSGAVRGECGHRHKTKAAAKTCADKDAKACRALGGGAYSDRGVYRVEPGDDFGTQDD